MAVSYVDNILDEIPQTVIRGHKLSCNMEMKALAAQGCQEEICAAFCIVDAYTQSIYQIALIYMESESVA